MSNFKKLMMSAATGGAGLNVEEVFSTYLYTGDYSNTLLPQTITNGIDLAGEGGMVWIKGRAFGAVTNTDYHNHFIDDTERGAGNLLSPNLTNAAGTISSGVDAFNSDGFDAGFRINISNGDFDYASWTFRKAPKFFDVVTYTGNGTNPRTISHNLGTTVGHITVKPTSSTGSWWNFHRTLGAGKALSLNSTDSVLNSNNFWGGVEPTSTEFTVQFNNNADGVEYVAYLFAHNDGDGEFGPDGDADIIKCGSFTGDNVTVNLGWEPQWVMVKRTNSSTKGEWLMSDSMRGWVKSGGRERFLAANSPLREGQDSGDGVYSNSDSWEPTSNGFKVYGYPFDVSGNYIYIAIRRGTKVPESGTEVFDVVTRTDSGSNTQHTVGFAPDSVLDMSRPTYSFNFWYDRLRGGTKYLATNSTGAEGNFDYITFDDATGKFTTKTQTSGGITFVDYAWKRAPGFFDVVAYSGDSTVGRTVSHNLGVAPEMMWTKMRSSGNEWFVYAEPIGNTNKLELDGTSASASAAVGGNQLWNSTTPTSSVFTLSDNPRVNESGQTYIAYLFASLPGISKVGSYTGTGAAFNVDCGFTSGARFVLIKKTSNTGDWGVFDTERGITDSSSPLLRLNNTTAEANFDYLDPYSGGFAHSGANSTFNASGETYIFYAIA